MDAEKYYRGYKGAGPGTSIASIVSLVVSYVQAIATSSTQPKDENLGNPDSELNKLSNNYNGYTKRPRK